MALRLLAVCAFGACIALGEECFGDEVAAVQGQVAVHKPDALNPPAEKPVHKTKTMEPPAKKPVQKTKAMEPPAKKPVQKAMEPPAKKPVQEVKVMQPSAKKPVKKMRARVIRHDFMPMTHMMDLLNKTLSDPKFIDPSGKSRQGANATSEIRKLKISWTLEGTEPGTYVRMTGRQCHNGKSCDVYPAMKGSAAYIEMKPAAPIDEKALMKTKMTINIFFINKVIEMDCPVCGGTCTSKMFGQTSTTTLPPCPIDGIWKMDMPLNHLQSMKDMKVTGKVGYHSTLIRDKDDPAQKKVAMWDTMTTF